MAKFNLLLKNAADSATLTASSSAGGLVPANLLTLERAAVWRSTSKTATLTLTWAAPVSVGVVALGRLNLTPTATITVARFSLPGDNTPLDSMQVTPDALPDLLAGSLPTLAQAWFATSILVRKVTITINDAANALNYLEAAYLVCGESLTLDFGPGYGASLGVEDSSQSRRAESGDMRTEAGVRSRVLKLPLEAMTNADADRLLLLATQGRGRLTLVSGRAFNQPSLSMLAVLQDDHQATWKTYGLWQSSLTFKEACAL